MARSSLRASNLHSMLSFFLSFLLLLCSMCTTASGLSVDAIMDSMTAMLGMGDVGCDVVVTKTYWDNAQATDEFPMFFTLSCAIMIFSSLVGTSMYFVYSFYVCRDRNNLLVRISTFLNFECCECIYLFLMLLLFIALCPFGIILPVVTWRMIVASEAKNPPASKPFAQLVQRNIDELFPGGNSDISLTAVEAKLACISETCCSVLMVAGMEAGPLLQEEATWHMFPRNCASKGGQKMRVSTSNNEMTITLGIEENGRFQTTQSHFHKRQDGDVWCMIAEQPRDTKPLPASLGFGPRSQILVLARDVMELSIMLVDVKVVVGYMLKNGCFFQPSSDAAITLKRFCVFEFQGPYVKVLVWAGSLEVPQFEFSQSSQMQFLFSMQAPFEYEYAQFSATVNRNKATKQLPFIVETGTEAIPQSMLQVSALVIYSQRDAAAISPWQFLSLATSLASLASKLYAMSTSMFGRLWYWKMSCLSLDLVGLFLTVASLWSSRRGGEDQIQLPWLSRPVDYPSGLWVIITSLQFVCLIFCGLCSPFVLQCWRPMCWHYEEAFSELRGSMCWLYEKACVPFTWHDSRSYEETRYIRFTIFVWILVFFGSIPLAIAVAAARASIFVIICRLRENELESSSRFYIKGYEFIMQGHDFRARMCAMNHVIQGLDEQSSCLLESDFQVIACGRWWQVIVFYLSLPMLAYQTLYPIISFIFQLYAFFTHDVPLNPFRLVLVAFYTVLLAAVVVSSILCRNLFRFMMYVKNKPDLGEELFEEIEKVYEEHYKDSASNNSSYTRLVNS